METTLKVPPQAHGGNRALFHFERTRLNQLFTEAVKYPLVIICAGAGYGKTSAVHDFAQEYQAATAWVQLSARDNAGARFWENYTHSMTQANTPLGKAMTKLGFPDTREKLKHFHTMLRDLVELKKRVTVMDDFHCIEDPSVLAFIEECIFHYIPHDTSVFLISRTIPNIKTVNNGSHDGVFIINEDDLRFTENELSQYFRSCNISLPQESLREIINDTGGWTFAINFIVRSFQKAPGYGGYVRNAMKSNIFQMIETGLWCDISENLQNFLLRLSLIDHLSIDLLTRLAWGDADLLAEFEKLNAYVRRDNYINAYLIHPLFLEFLHTKQDTLPKEQKHETYAMAGDWCAQNGFKIDAMSYYEKTENYQSIVSILNEFAAQIPPNIAQYASAILDRAPAHVFDEVEFLVEMHLRTYIYQGLWEKSLELAKRYEARFLKLPEDNIVRKHTLAWLYVTWSYLRILMCVMDNVFDSYVYVAKADKYISTSIYPGRFGPYCPGPWINCAGSSKKGVPDEFLASLNATKDHITHNFTKDFMAGVPELTRGELDFYRGNIDSAAPFVALAVKIARSNKQIVQINRALYYALRLAAAQGNLALMEQLLKETKEQLDATEYYYRFIDYDIALSWYYCYLGLPDKVADWLKEDFSPYLHASFFENFGNQIKARYCYAVRNYPPLLSYIEEMKTRESFLFGRIEMLAMEACVHYKMKNKEKALAVFEEAYKEASPNEIVMPFIELGKDMRTLTSAALKETSCAIPKAWLEDINRKSASYAKYQSNAAAKYKNAARTSDDIDITPREKEILADLCKGLSRSEIAASHNLSINTVKMVIKHIYAKLNVENLADLIRIAVEKKLT
jgi:LuxR family maltose regulon positive regulatory protein